MRGSLARALCGADRFEEAGAEILRAVELGRKEPGTPAHWLLSTLRRERWIEEGDAARPSASRLGIFTTLVYNSLGSAILDLAKSEA